MHTIVDDDVIHTLHWIVLQMLLYPSVIFIVMNTMIYEISWSKLWAPYNYRVNVLE